MSGMSTKHQKADAYFVDAEIVKLISDHIDELF